MNNVRASNPVPMGKDETLSAEETAYLISSLKRMRARAQAGERERQAKDRKGAKMYYGYMWQDGITAGRLAITSNQAVSLYERLAGTITRYSPVPNVVPINDADVDAADILNGALRQNWEWQDMQNLTKRSQRLCGFTRPVLWYNWWDQQARNGLGDMRTRIIPGHRSIIDNRFYRLDDMEFVGFSERMTRARLMMLFPDKAREIEAASARDSNQGPNVGGGDPLRMGKDPSGAGTLDRLVQSVDQNSYNDNHNVFSGKTTVRSNKGRSFDPMTREVEAEFLWIEDNTPKKVRKPRLDLYGNPVTEIVKNEETGEIEFETEGHDVLDTPFGPVLSPRLKPKTREVFVEEVVRKYAHRRHIAWVPGDNVILWDVDWTGPLPLASHRDAFPLDGYWSEGTALRLSTLAIARNILYTIIFERLKLSLSGTWLATQQSGLKGNKLTPEDGQVFYARKIDEQNIKQFPTQPLDSAYFNLLGTIEAEMMKLLGITQAMQGEASQARAESGSVYDKLIEAGSVAIIDRAQLLESAYRQWAISAAWFMQNFYTHEHLVEIEQENGQSSWVQASAFAMRGDMSINVETGSMIAWSESAQFERAKEYAQLGFYTLPMLGRMGRVPHWQEGLREKGRISKDPSLAYLMPGASGPPVGGTPGGRTPSPLSKSGQRSHHKAGGKT